MLSKSNTTKIAGEGTLFLTLGNVLLKIIGLATIFITLRHFNLYEYGVLELAIATVALFSLFQLPGLDDAVTSDFLVEKGLGNYSRMKSIFLGYFWAQAILGTVACAILFLGAEFISHYYQSSITVLIRVLALPFLLLPFRSAFTLLFSTEFKFGSQVLYSVLEELGKLIFLIVLLFVFHFSIEAVPLAALFSQCIALVILFPFAARIYRKFSHEKAAPDFSFWKNIWGHGKWSIAVSYGTSFTQSARIWLVKTFIGTEAVAIYSVAHGFYSHITSLVPLNRVTNLLISQAWGEDQRKVNLLILKTIKYQGVIYILVGIAAFVGGPILITQLFPQYVTSIVLFQLMLIALIPLSASPTLGQVFLLLKRQRELFWVTIRRLIASIVVMPVFLHFFGLQGAAIELGIVTLILILDRLVFVRKHLPDFSISLTDMIKLDAIDRIILDKIWLYGKGITAKFLRIK